jgi:hypothetical protein
MGTLKDLGVVVMPEATWKVAVIMPRDNGLADVDASSDVTVLAVMMPNSPEVDPDWHTYITTVDAVEAASGYDLLDLLPDNIERIVEGPARGLGGLLDSVVAAGGLDHGNANALQSKLDAAAKHIAAGRNTPAMNVIDAFINQVTALTRAGRLSEADAAALTAEANSLLTVLGQ